MPETLVDVIWNVCLTYRIVLGIVELSIWYFKPLASPLSAAAPPTLCPTPDVSIGAQATVVCATQNQDPALFVALATWLAEGPYQVIIVANPTVSTWISTELEYRLPDDSARVKIIHAPFTHKRRQLCLGFEISTTPVTIICDDDTKWTKGVLSGLLRPLLARPEVGCVFPDLQIDPVGDDGWTIWEVLGQMRHAGDGVDFHSSLTVDGGVFCHHGSTAAYRTEILAEARFRRAFSNETWRGRDLNSGDDQFLCRWLTNEGWRVALCSAEDCLVRTRTRDSWRHLLQLLRWSRNDWRASLSTLIWERTIWRRHPFTAWLRIVWALRILAPFVEIPFLLSHPSMTTLGLLLGSRLFRYIPFLAANPQYLWLLPLFCCHLYAHTALKIYALFTLTNTDWI